jgi:cytidyltransferase-like protein
MAGTVRDIAEVIGKIPYRMALAGGWIDQPFVSRLNPEPPGSMVVVSLQPAFRFMERAGMATGTRRVALKLWPEGVPRGALMGLVRELYAAENAGLADPSGSQDMIGLIYPGISRIDYRADHEGGVFPCHVESNCDPAVARWLEQVIQVLPVKPRPAGYHPLVLKNLEPEWIRRLGQSGKMCFEAIVGKDLGALGASMNLCMECWERLLPGTVRHPALTVDLGALLRHYQGRYAGAMYSGCGGGYLYVVSDEVVAGARQVRFLDEAARRGAVHVLLWSDALTQAMLGRAPKFPLAERRYFVEALRYVQRVTVIDGPPMREGVASVAGIEDATWLVDQAADLSAQERFCQRAGWACVVMGEEELRGFAVRGGSSGAVGVAEGRKKVLITGSFDWLHTGHVRFFEEVASYGDLYAVVGHDGNIALLKGPGHPQFSQDERLYMVQAIRFVKEAMISTGHGWLDAEPEIQRIRPDIYAVNEDGDKPEKRAYCREHGIEYLVLKRLPKAGLPRRESTVLRGF